MRLQAFSTGAARMRQVAAAAAIAGAFVPLLLRTVWADVRYTVEMKPVIPDAEKEKLLPGMEAPTIRTTTMLKDGNERTEMDMKFGPMGRHMVSLTLCDKKQVIQLDSASKLYTATPIGTLPGAETFAKMMDMMHPQPSRPKPEGTEGKVVNSFKVTDLGDEKVAERTAHHVMIDMTSESSGCAGVRKVTMKMELWTAPLKGAHGCQEVFAPSRTMPTADGCRITYETKGDLDKLMRNFGGMMVKMKLFDGDNKLVMTEETRDYSDAVLDAGLFAIPSGYKEVSESEFQQAQARSQVNPMAGAGQIPGIDSDTAAKIADAQRQVEEAQKEGDKQAAEAAKNQGGSSQENAGESEKSGDESANGQSSGDEPKKEEKKKGIKIPKIKLPF
jgi:hypothetical protein